jgi:hypothetical protein
VDSRLLRSLRVLATRPGFITNAYIATAAVYEAGGWPRALKVGLLATVIAAAVPGYRFLIFLVTLYLT